jgi:hypothetical protein
MTQAMTQAGFWAVCFGHFAFGLTVQASYCWLAAVTCIFIFFTHKYTYILRDFGKVRGGPWPLLAPPSSANVKGASMLAGRQVEVVAAVDGSAAKVGAVRQRRWVGAEDDVLLVEGGRGGERRGEVGHLRVL